MLIVCLMDAGYVGGMLHVALDTLSALLVVGG